MAQVRETPRDGAIGYWTDDWDGYPASRTRLPQHIHTSRVANPVVIGGAIHAFWANDLGRRPQARLRRYDLAHRRHRVRRYLGVLSWSELRAVHDVSA